jgi:hypothetical protein
MKLAKLMAFQLAANRKTLNVLKPAGIELLSGDKTKGIEELLLAHQIATAADLLSLRFARRWKCLGLSAAVWLKAAMCCSSTAQITLHQLAPQWLSG